MNEFVVHRLRKFLYSAAVFSFVFQYSIYQAEPNFSYLMKGPAAICLYISILLSSYLFLKEIGVSVKRNLVKLLVLLFAIYLYLAYHYTLIPIVLLIFASSKIDSDFVIIVFLKSNFTVLCFFLLMWSLGIAKDQLTERMAGEEELTIYTFGFIHYFGFAFRVFCCSILYLYLKRGQVDWFRIIVVIVVNLVTYQFTHTRLHIILFFIFIILYLLYYKTSIIHFEKKIYKIIGLSLYPVCMLLFFLFITAPFSGIEDLQQLWDSETSGRIMSTLFFFDKYGVTLLGNEITMRGIGALADTGESELFLDAGFAYWVLAYGLIFTALIVYGYIRLFSIAFEKQDGVLFIWLLVFCIGNFINDFFTNADINPVVFLLFTKMSNMNTEREGKLSYYGKTR